VILPSRRTAHVDDRAIELFTPGLRDLTAQQRELIDPQDPDLEYVLDAIRLMRMAGCDVEDLDVLALAVDAGHRRADRENDDSGLLDQRHRERREDIAALRARELARRDVRARVYYARVGNRVKIGYSLDVKRRMVNINPEELLAVEPGGPIKEAERHQQFASLWVHGEWFRFDGPLIEHVSALQTS
jgi:hypothetical protein